MYRQQSYKSTEQREKLNISSRVGETGAGCNKISMTAHCCQIIHDLYIKMVGQGVKNL